MSSAVSLHVRYRIANARIRPFPFPHIYVRDVFPADFYEDMLDRLPEKEALKTLTSMGRVAKDYSESRFVLPLTARDLGGIAPALRDFWGELAGWMLGGGFGQLMVATFAEFLQQRLGDLTRAGFHDEALLVQDYTTYALGPHTDSPLKVLSFLFYLPADDSRPHLGTSLYLPKDPSFLCTGGPHYPFERFQRVCTMPYLPNTLFAFPKSANSFHGVEPIADTPVRRDLLLYDIKVENPPELAQGNP